MTKHKPERREYRRFGKKYIITNSAVALIGLAGFAFVWIDIEATGIHFWIGLSVFICAIASLIGMDVYRFRHFRCPECGCVLPKPDFPNLHAGDSIPLVCSTCDIEWHTGLDVPDE